jgi:hypothetical protein
MKKTALCALLLLSLSHVACSAAPDAAEEAAESASEDALSRAQTGIEVKARVREGVVGTPTIGSPATAPFLSIEVTVDDRQVRTQHRGFDGFERAFALVPRQSDGGTKWTRVELAYRGTSQRGYIALYPVDLYEASSLRLTDSDRALVSSLGIAVGLDTNVGTVWAQNYGDNFRPQDAR